jgi:aldehyde:ferredoxin oxidoreductase
MGKIVSLGDFFQEERMATDSNESTENAPHPAENASHPAENAPHPAENASHPAENAPNEDRRCLGYTGTILRVDLGTGEMSEIHPKDSFYRMYMGGSAIGTYFLLKETAPDVDPFDPANVLTLAAGVTTAAPVSGASRFCITALSPLTGAVGDSQAGGNFGPFLKRAGYDAVVIVGRAAEPVVLVVNAAGAELRPAKALYGKPVSVVWRSLVDELGKRDLSVVQCGPAGEKQVRFACLMVDRNDVGGRTGMGAVFGAKNLRAVAVKGDGEVKFADPEAFKPLNRRGVERLPDTGFPPILKEYGTPGAVGPQARAGNLATHNYSRSTYAHYETLDGPYLKEHFDAGGTTCYGCVVRCRKRVRAEKPYPLTEELGGPEFETLGLLGSNVDVADGAAVARASQLCGEYGMDTLTMGGLAAYMCECMEKGLISPEQVDGRTVRFGDAASVLWLIEATGRREGVGDVLAESFVGAVAHFGAGTAPFAVHTKNQGLAVHMPQVKPSQALMYAACPIGPDHQSSEHDWLLAGGGDVCRGLAIVGEGDGASTGPAKVRATLYSQQYYSLMDTLCLCMFCWGPGNLFSYRDLESFVASCTGWQTTFFELMKVGERRINMMRQLNARRGFDRTQDTLPERVFEPLPDGPAKGRHVERERFSRMLNLYYQMMGWDVETGNPTFGKLAELGLEWTVDADDQEPTGERTADTHEVGPRRAS